MRLFLAALLVVAGALPAGAQWLDRKTPDIPRTADGKPNLAAPAPRGPDGKLDLTGIWNGPTPEPRLDPANELPWVNALVRQRQQEYHKGRPSYQCLPSGPEADRFAGWKRIIQTPAAIAILNEDQTYRLIHMDGRALEADAAASWMGYSVGRWDGDTLVVESNGFNDKTWLSRYGQAHTEALRVTERYRRTDVGHLQVEVTFTDPAAYVKPWSFKADLSLAADTEMLESICERSSDHWTGTRTEATSKAITVPADVLAKYVGVYGGMYLTRPRTVEVTLSGGQLIARVIGAAGVDGGEIRPLVPQSQTMFEGAGLYYEFIVDDTGNATAVVQINITGPYRFARQR
ncbi:MAG: hypothetical protein HY824_12180 [Acidobacteria bacterium]|nr:hypothetical protein [Acidobacteriota bacterium]